MFGQGGLNDHVDVDELMDEADLDRREIERRKGFLDFGREDVQRLTRFEDTLDAHSGDAPDQLYAGLLPDDEGSERSQADIDRLRGAQEAYLETLAGGKYGLEYFRNRAALGTLYEQLDVPISQYIGQYGVYQDLLAPIVTGRIQDRVSEHVQELAPADAGEHATNGDEFPAEVSPADLERRIHEEITEGIEEFHSMLKLLTLDMQAGVDGYVHSSAGQSGTRASGQPAVSTDLQGAISEVTDASEDIATSTADISDLAENQTGQMSEVANEVSNLSATVEEVASSATQVEQQSDRTRDLASDGLETAGEATDEMDKLDGARLVIENRVSDLEDQIDEIDEVIEVINDIADQTNLLALNANIEAARAGKAGAGFAVVADEIKSLAEETQTHAEDIEAMIDRVRGAATETISTLGQVEDGIQTGAERVTDTEEMLERIKAEAEETVAGMKEISDATDEQAASAEEIAAIVDEARELSERLATEIQHVAAATDEQATTLSELEASVQRRQD
jgi:heme-based aerotactic transducer